MTLGEYLTTSGVSQDDFASSIGTTQATVSRYMSGKRFPSRSTIQSITLATGGAVRPEDWFRKEVAA